MSCTALPWLPLLRLNYFVTPSPLYVTPRLRHLRQTLHISTHLQKCEFTHVDICTCIFVYTCIHTYTCIHVCIYIHTYVHTYTCTHVCIYIYTCVHTYADNLVYTPLPDMCVINSDMHVFCIHKHKSIPPCMHTHIPHTKREKTNTYFCPHKSGQFHARGPKECVTHTYHTHTQYTFKPNDQLFARNSMVNLAKGSEDYVVHT